MRSYCKIACGKSCGHSAGVGTEISAEWATAMAKIPRLALTSSFHRFCKVGGSSNDHIAISVFLFYLSFEEFFYAVHFKRRLVFSIRQLRNPIPVATYANKRFNMVVPWSNILV